MAPQPQKTSDLEALRDIAGDVDEAEFIPYAGLLDRHNVITKNGELLQTIRIPGLSYENANQESMELRRALREAIKAHIRDDSLALWLHTTRLECDLSLSVERPTVFASEMAAKWNEKNRFAKQFTNDVYLSLVYEGQDAEILSAQSFARGLIPRLDLKWRNAYLDGIAGKLDAVARKMATALAPFGAERLGIVERNGRYESETLRFLNQIINFTDAAIPVRDIDLSDMLNSGEVSFAFNAMEVRSPTGRRRFAAILSLKEYKEKSLPFIDKFLKLPIEFVVTQCISFAEAKKARDSYTKQKRVHALGEDAEVSRLTEFDDILASDTGHPNDFAEQQLSIFIIADSVRQLERNLRHGINHLSRHGIVCFREDLKFEECYWAQMPGNFEFVSRLQPTPTGRVAGFANLYTHPVGLRQGNRWGEAITTLHTANNAPYFFNFHVGEAGHTIILGQEATERRLLAHFLVAEATKAARRVICFDPDDRQLPLVERLEGETHVFSPDANGPPVLLNPFSLTGGEGNRRFLARWLGVLLRCAGQTLGDADKAAITEAIAAIYADSGPRYLSRFLDLMTVSHPEVAVKFDVWRQGGAYGHLFDHESDIFDGGPRVHGLHIKAILNELALAPPLLSYLLQKATASLEGEPTIFLLEEAWSLIGQTHIAPEVGTWLDYLTQKNAIAIFTTMAIEDAGLKPFTSAIVEKAVTQIYFPDPHPDEAYMERFGLNELEFSYLDVIDAAHHHFLLKRLGNTIIAEFDLTGMDEAKRVLAGEEESLPQPAESAEAPGGYWGATA